MAEYHDPVLFLRMEVILWQNYYHLTFLLLCPITEDMWDTFGRMFIYIYIYIWLKV